MTVTPSSRVPTCMRCLDTGPAAASAAATCPRLEPHSNATAAAHSAFDTWWSPCSAGPTDPHHPRGRLVGHRGDRGVVDVEDYHSRRRNSLREFGFRRGDGLT